MTTVVVEVTVACVSTVRTKNPEPLLVSSLLSSRSDRNTVGGEEDSDAQPKASCMMKEQLLVGAITSYVRTVHNALQ